MNIKTGLDLHVSLGGASADPSANARGRRLFDLHAGGQVFDVVRFRGREAASSLFSFELVLLSDLEWPELHPLLLGHAATLAMHGENVPTRLVNGIVAELALVGEREVNGARLRELKLRLVPRMHLLKHRRNSRIFQEMSVVDVVSAVLRDARVPFRWATTGAFSRRAYCLQHEETDYEFVRRLLAEEGIFFFFQQPLEIPIAGAEAAPELTASIGAAAKSGDPLVDEGSAIVVFGNSPIAYLPVPEQAAPPEAASGFSVQASVSIGSSAATEAAIAVAPAIPYRERHDALTAAAEAVHAFSPRAAVRTNAVELRDYDFQKPALKLIGRASLDAVDASLAATPSGVSASVQATPGGRLESYDHRGDYEEPDAANPVARVHLEQHRADATLANGSSAVKRLAPGYLFALGDHTVESLNQAYVVTKVRHKASTAELTGAAYGYENSFECVPAGVAFRPRRPKVRMQQVVETAVVTGPAGEEIHTDRFGRIKVQFRWDREGKYNEYSSCWIRVQQPWAGASWGFQFIPRVGMEVLIAFLGGDVDRPVVMGAAYNGTHPTPFVLPQDKTRSGIRTQSTPGGDGHNELSFEDRQGAEQVLLHAQRDLDEVVNRNHTLRVERDETIRVGGSRHDTVLGDAVVDIRRSCSETVQGAKTSRVDGDVFDLSSGSRHCRTAKDFVVHVDGAHRTEIRGITDARLHDDATVRTDGCFTLTVGRHDARRSSLVHVEGESRFSSTEETEIRADKGITLRCGQSSLRISKNGICIQSPQIFLRGDDVALQAKNLRAVAAASVEMQAVKIGFRSEDATLVLGKSALIASPTVSIGADPEEVARQMDSSNVKPTKISLRRKNGKPIAGQRYILTFDDGAELTGVVGEDGTDEVYIAKPANIRWPDAQGS